MLDVLSLLIGIVLGVLLTGASLVLWSIRRRHRPSEYLTLDEVRHQIDADSVQSIEEWRTKRANTARSLSGRGVA